MSIRPLTLFASMMLLNPPCLTMPVTRMVTSPAIMIIHWNASAHTTAFSPPYIAIKFMYLIQNQSLYCKTSYSYTLRTSFKRLELVYCSKQSQGIR